MNKGRMVSWLQVLLIASTAMALLSFGTVFAQHDHSGKTTEQSNDMLMPGTYTAKVKAIVCGGCGPMIQKTLQGFKELDTVTVDQKSKTVQFSVKKDSMTTASTLQKALDTAAKRMGMGADYTLTDLKPKS